MDRRTTIIACIAWIGAYLQESAAQTSIVGKWQDSQFIKWAEDKPPAPRVLELILGEPANAWEAGLSKLVVRYGGREVTISAAEIFEALAGKPIGAVK